MNEMRKLMETAKALYESYTLVDDNGKEHEDGGDMEYNPTDYPTDYESDDDAIEEEGGIDQFRPANGAEFNLATEFVDSDHYLADIRVEVETGNIHILIIPLANRSSEGTELVLDKEGKEISADDSLPGSNT